MSSTSLCTALARKQIEQFKAQVRLERHPYFPVMTRELHIQ